MLALARENQRKAGVTNVEFLKGELENIPLPDASVDVIISNCVVNLSADKDRALSEAFRVLKPGGRFAVSDVVVRGEVPAEVRKSVELWIGCLAGALEEKEFEAKLTRAGFTGRRDRSDAGLHLRGRARLPRGDVGAAPAEVDGKFMSAFVRATKPAHRLRRDERAGAPKRLNFFERYLTLWVGLCMVAGVALGKLLPGLTDAHPRARVRRGKPDQRRDRRPDLAHGLPDDAQDRLHEHSAA